MERLPRPLLDTLREHWDRKSIPDHGSPACEAFEEVGRLLCEFGDSTWPPDPGAGLTPRQTQCCALFYVVSATVWNGLTTGVLVNQPGVIRPAIKAARDLDLTAALPVLQQLDAALPQDMREEQHFEARIEWMQSISDSDLERQLEALNTHFDGGDASNEIFLACVAWRLITLKSSSNPSPGDPHRTRRDAPRIMR